MRKGEERQGGIVTTFQKTYLKIHTMLFNFMSSNSS